MKANLSAQPRPDGALITARLARTVDWFSTIRAWVQGRTGSATGAAQGAPIFCSVRHLPEFPASSTCSMRARSEARWTCPNTFRKVASARESLARTLANIAGRAGRVIVIAGAARDQHAGDRGAVARPWNGHCDKSCLRRQLVASMTAALSTTACETLRHLQF